MTELCPYCGTPLVKCVNGLLCPNHGLIIEINREEKRDEASQSG